MSDGGSDGWNLNEWRWADVDGELSPQERHQEAKDTPLPKLKGDRPQVQAESQVPILPTFRLRVFYLLTMILDRHALHGTMKALVRLTNLS
jgi:hypothetical protein